MIKSNNQSYLNSLYIYNSINIHELIYVLWFSVKGGMVKSKCDICGKPAKGFAFICTACGYQMHPCCAMLNTKIDYAPHQHTLRILPATATVSSADSTGFVCGECKRKRSGRVYHCTVCDYHLHAWCAKSKINGLQANGIKVPEKPSMFVAAGRVASKVVTGFIEGLAEGLGEVLAQNINKGKH